MTRTLNDCLTGIKVPDFDGDLTCALPDDGGDFPWRTPGWLICPEGLDPLWLEGDVVGDFSDLGSIDGQLAQAVYRTGSRWDLDLLVTGAYGPTTGGDPDPDYDTFVAYDDPWAGLEANLELLRTNVLKPLETGDGTRPHTLTMPSGDTRTADVTVVPRLDLVDKFKWVRKYTVTFAIAEGRFS